MEAKAGGVKEVTTGQMDKIKSVLKTKGFDKPGWWRKIRPGNQSESYEQAVEDVAFKVQAKVDAMVKSAKASGKSIEVGNRLYKKVIDDMTKKYGNVYNAVFEMNAIIESQKVQIEAMDEMIDWDKVEEEE